MQWIAVTTQQLVCNQIAIKNYLLRSTGKNSLLLGCKERMTTVQDQILRSSTYDLIRAFAYCSVAGLLRGSPIEKRSPD